VVERPFVAALAPWKSGHLWPRQREQKIQARFSAAVEPGADGESELDALFVEPGMQRHGIGRRLLAHCAEFARAQGSGALHVVGNPHAEDFYIACGFKVIGTTETRFGTGLLMRIMI
jgi:GNAT superfamily N-acetyltransferase